MYRKTLNKKYIM